MEEDSNFQNLLSRVGSYAKIFIHAICNSVSPLVITKGCSFKTRVGSSPGTLYMFPVAGITTRSSNHTNMYIHVICRMSEQSLIAFAGISSDCSIYCFGCDKTGRPCKQLAVGCC